MKPRKLKVFLAGYESQFLEVTRKTFDLAERKLSLLNLHVVNPCNVQKGEEYTEFLSCNAIYLVSDEWASNMLARKCFEHAVRCNYSIYMQHQFDIIVKEYQQKVIC